MQIRLFLLAAVTAVGCTGLARAQDAAAGAAVFKSVCATCHSPLEHKNMVGPSLFGVVGRPAGQIPGFHYSPANKGSGLTWDTETLNRYIASPQTVVPKTIMPYQGLKDDIKRADLIAYLETLQ